MSPSETPHDPDPITHVPFRIGIVGGMGPMAGVYLQQLIIEATPAERDQDHFEVVCFTNPHVPERMRSLAEDGGRRYAAAVIASAALLERAGATHLVIPCNTAHARLTEIQRGVTVPVIDMIDLAVRRLVVDHGTERPVGLLATIGTLNEGVYEKAPAGAGLTWVRPDPEQQQQQVAEVILAIKQGHADQVRSRLREVCARLVERGAGTILVGCTELSMIADAIDLGVAVVDPLRLLAAHLVEVGRNYATPRS